MNSGPAAPWIKVLVLDANILVRAALGRRVLTILESHAGRAHFLASEIAFVDVRTHLPVILAKKGLPAGVQLWLYRLLRCHLLSAVGFELPSRHAIIHQQALSRRDSGNLCPKRYG